jgi:predicted phage tail protein|tara:strand:- start:1872 stop:2447 length:576 start_codon:yes stop_codon:yes gene_type:complete
MLKKIKVYGFIRKYTGQSEFMADVNSPHEAFSFLFCNFKGLEQKMVKQHFCVKVGDKPITEDLLSIRTEQDIKIIPLVHGNFIMFVGGLLLKYAAKEYIKTKIISTILTYVAVSMITQGLNNLISPQQNTQNPQSREDPLDPSSLASNYSFTGLTNISQAGIPVNLAYGEIVVGSIVVSNGIDTVQVEGTN